MPRRYERTDCSKLKIVSSNVPIPPKRNGPRPYNEDHIISKGVAGLISGKYKRYTEAARDLEHLVRKVGDVSTRIDRLRRKISIAYRAKTAK